MQMRRRALPDSGGTLVTSNLFLGVYVPDAPWLATAAEYRRRILEDLERRPQRVASIAADVNALKDLIERQGTH